MLLQLRKDSYSVQAFLSVFNRYRGLVDFHTMDSWIKKLKSSRKPSREGKLSIILME